MNYMQNIRKLYAIKFFHNLVPAYVIERLFWQQRGMSIQMVVYTEIIYALTIVLLEIPTGIIADKWGRKKMIVINAFLSCCEFAILINATKFWHFAAAVFLAGVGRSACSGSENALFYDSLKECGKAELFEKYLGRLNVFDFSAVIIAALCGSVLACRFGFEFNYWLSLGAVFISFCISLMLVDTDIKSKADEPTAINEYVKASLGFFRKNPYVCVVLLAGMVTGAALNFIDEFWQLYIGKMGIPVMYFGLISAAFMITRMPGNIFAYALKKRVNCRSLLAVIIFIFAVGFLCLSVVKGYAGLVVICIIFVVSGIVEPIASGYLHHRIDSSMRATIDSFQSLGLRAMLTVVGLGFGYFSREFDIYGGYGFIAGFCGVFLVFFLITSKKYAE